MTVQVWVKHLSNLTPKELEYLKAAIDAREELETVNPLVSNSCPTELETVNPLVSNSCPTQLETGQPLVSNSCPTQLETGQPLVSNSSIPVPFGTVELRPIEKPSGKTYHYYYWRYWEGGKKKTCYLGGSKAQAVRKIAAIANSNPSL